MAATRTQIYLDDDQRRALKTLATSSNSTVSDLVRRAITRLLSEEFATKDWAIEMRALSERIRASGPELSDEEIGAAIAARRARERSKAGA